ncbi:hypothetical protein [Microbispora corallina]|nr:hypothetical protein [Microbispora corallina]
MSYSTGVMGVHGENSTYETWPFECLHCLRVWEEEYLVQRVPDGHGADVAVWTRGGVQVQPPWSGMICPECGCGTVTTFPIGYLAHHKEIPLTRPGPGADAPARRPRAPLAPHTVTTLAIVLLAGLGLYQRVR